MACKKKSLLLGGLAVLLFFFSTAEVVSGRHIIKPEAIDLRKFHVQNIVNDRQAQHYVDNESNYKVVQNAEQSHDDALAVPSPDESSPAANANLHFFGWLRALLGGSPPGPAPTGQPGVASGPIASDGGN